MANLYIREAFHTLDYEQEADAAIEEGEFVSRTLGGGIAAFDPATDTRIDGIVPHQSVSDRLTETDEDYVAYSDVYVYDAGDGPVPLQPISANDHIQPRTVKDDTETAPSFDKNEEVGVATVSGDQVVVPAGYTDSGGTQYGDGGAGDYTKLGYVVAAPSKYETVFGERVEVRVSGDNV